MNSEKPVSIMNLHWGYSFGGISQYVLEIERVTEGHPLTVSNVCILNRKRHVDEDALDRLSGLRIIERKGLWDLRWIYKLKDIALQQQPDLIFSHAFNSHFVALVLRILTGKRYTFVASYHGRYHPPTLIKRLLGGFYNRFNEWYLARVATRTICVAQCGKAYLVSRGVPEDSIEVVHNGIPDLAEQGDRHELRETLGLPDDSIVIGAIARLEPVKGIAYLLKAFGEIHDEVPNAHLCVIGSGVEEEELKRWTAERGIGERVHFAGFVPNAARFLPAFDIFVLPSLSEFHSIGLLEAMRASRAIVATDVGGNTESITDGVEGLVIDSESVEQLATAIKRLVLDEHARSDMAGAARQRYEREFRIDVMLDKTRHFLQQAVDPA